MSGIVIEIERKQLDNPIGRSALDTSYEFIFHMPYRIEDKKRFLTLLQGFGDSEYIVHAKFYEPKTEWWQPYIKSIETLDNGNTWKVIIVEPALD